MSKLGHNTNLEWPEVSFILQLNNDFIDYHGIELMIHSLSMEALC